MMLDKNGKQISKDCYICIDGMNTPFLVVSDIDIGIVIEVRYFNPLPIEVLKDNKTKLDCYGLVSLSFLKSEKILICPKSEYPECYI